MATYDEIREKQAFSTAGHGPREPVAGDRILFLGHATTLIELDGTRLSPTPSCGVRSGLSIGGSRRHSLVP